MKIAIKYYLLTVFVIYQFNLIGQITLTEGGKITVFNNTSIKIFGSNDTLKILDSSRITNNGQIILNPSVSLLEQPLYPISGLGYETSLNDTLMIGWNNPGNLGLAFNTLTALSNTEIFRYHIDTLQQLSTYNSIKRCFSVSSNLNNLTTPIKIYYDSTELNGFDKSYLKIINFSLSGLNVFQSEDSTMYYINNGFSDSLNLMTLTEVSQQLDTLSDTIFCSKDTLMYSFDTNGPFNSNNEFNLWITNGTDTIILNTTNYADTFYVEISDTILGGEYDIFISSTNAMRTDQFINSIYINELPNIIFPTMPSFCTNDDSLIVNTALPLGGLYSGSGMVDSVFYPQMVGVGNYLIEYVYTDTNGCSNFDTTTFIVNPSPTIVLTTPPSLCELDDSLLLNYATPPGGVYSGFGVIDTLFNPSIGAGNYIITYDYMNNFGCSAVDSFQIDVFSNPLEPIISQNGSVLATGNESSYQWYLNGFIITGETGQFLSATTDGFYQVEVFNANGCSTLSQPYNYSTIGIDENFSDNEFILFPNPALNQFTVKSKGKINEGEIVLYNLEGKIIEQRKFEQLEIFNVSTLPAGYYLVKIFSNKSVTNIKLIINK